jgi:cytochrome c551/c552
MELFEQFISPPPESYLSLLKDILIVLSVIHFTVMGMLTGGMLYSLISTIEAKKKNDRLLLRWAREMALPCFPQQGHSLMLGLIPLVCSAVIQAQILYHSGLQTPLFTIVAAILLLCALIAINLYVSSFNSREEKFTFHLISGFAGAALLCSAYLVYFYGTELMLIYKQDINAPSFALNLVFRNGVFLAFSLAIAAAGNLFFRPGAENGGDRDYEIHVRQRAVRPTAVFAILQGILGFLVLATMAPGARSEDVVGPEALMLLLLFALLIMVYRSELGFEMPLFITLVLIVVMTSYVEGINRETAMRKHTKTLIASARELEKQSGMFPQEDVPEGKEIFRTSCTSCHAYARRLTGPPMKDVLPRYEGKEGELRAFIMNPRRVNNDYPPMPRPAILDDETKAVSEYLLGEYLKENRGK